MTTRTWSREKFLTIDGFIEKTETETMRIGHEKWIKAAGGLFLLAYSLVVIVAIVRDFICNFHRVAQMELPAPAKFLAENCYSATGYSPYFTYVEMMFAAVFLIWIPLVAYRKDARSALLATMCGFMGQTFLGACLLTVLLAPLCSVWQLETLDRPQAPTVIAVGIHYAALASLVFALVLLIRRLTKNAK